MLFPPKHIYSEQNYSAINSMVLGLAKEGQGDQPPQGLFHIPVCTSVLLQRRIRYTDVKMVNFLNDTIDRKCSINSY